MKTSVLKTLIAKREKAKLEKVYAKIVSVYGSGVYLGSVKEFLEDARGPYTFSINRIYFRIKARSNINKKSFYGTVVNIGSLFVDPKLMFKK